MKNCHLISYIFIVLGHSVKNKLKVIQVPSSKSFHLKKKLKVSSMDQGDLKYCQFFQGALNL